MRAVVCGGKPEQINDARRILLSEGVTCEAEDAATYERLHNSLATAEPDVVVVFCEADNRGSLAAVETAHHLVTGPVLAVGELDANLMHEAKRAGARDFLDINNLRRDLTAALGAVGTAETFQGEDSKRGRIVSVFSPSNGAGVTTIALNLAVSIAKRDKESAVALVDITPPPSDLSLLLDISPKHSLADVLHHQDRLDRRLISGAMTSHESGLQVLAQAGFAEDLKLPSFDISTPILRQLYVLLRKSFDVSVIDLGHAMTEVQFEAFRLSNAILMCVVADVPGLRRARWALDTAESNGIGRDRFQIIVNRYGAKNTVPKAKVEEALHTKIATTLGDHGPTLSAARNEGVPAIEMSGSIASAFNSLIKMLRLNETGVKV